jgi:hypothetical protein
MKQFEKNIHSQFGEDGVIEEVFKRIGVRWSTCVEFGAWDGLHLSNTLHLWRSLGWKALLIERDPEKYRALQKNTAGYSRVQALNRAVSPSGMNHLEALIEESGFPRDVDLLSIDIDGDDIYILESLDSMRPRVVVVEFNPTIPAHINVRQSPGEYFGASAMALCEVARLKGYLLAHATHVNLFFVHAAEFNKLGIAEPRLGDMIPQDHITYLISSYDGSAFLSQVPAYFPAGTASDGRIVDIGPYRVSRIPAPMKFPRLAQGGDRLVSAEVRIKHD